MKNTRLIFLFLATLVLACNQKNEDNSFEKNVLLEIIPSIVDSTCGDPRIPFMPTLGKYVEKGDRMILDTSLTTIEQRKEYKKWKLKRDSLKKDTASIYLAFNPIIKPSTDDLKVFFEKHFAGKKIAKPHIESYELNFNEIKLNQHFKLKHDSLFYKDYRVWMQKYDFVFSGFFEVSKILFDESKNYGVLSTDYTCQSRCGKGHLVFIKKVKGKWIIDKMKMTWIS